MRAEPAPPTEESTRHEETGPALEAVNIVKEFPVHRGGRENVGGRKVVHAVDGVSLSLYSGQVTALVGESGSGKSTIARLLAQLYPLTSGTIELGGRPVRAGRGRRFRTYVRTVQMIFQDPFSSLNPTRTIGYQLSRPLKIHGYARRKAEVQAEIARLLKEVNLIPPAQFSEKFPHELSGGQLQRVAVARALAARPKVLLADEPVSMLDVSIRLGLLNLLKHLVDERQLALLYITHDIASARYFADTTLVMYAGQLVEGGPSEIVTQHPAHPYTQLLISSAPAPDRSEADAAATAASGEVPSLVTPPTGCRFHPRCPHAMAICTQAFPPRDQLDTSDHWVSCWLHSQEEAVDRTPIGRPSLSAPRS